MRVARVGVFERPALLTLRQVLPRGLTVSLLVWMAIVMARGALLALQTFGLPVAGEPLRNFATQQMIWAAALVYLLCLAAALLARRFAGAATIPVAIVVGCAVVFATAVATSTVGSVLTIFALSAIVWLLGDWLLSLLPSSPTSQILRVPIAIGLGQGVLGLLLLLLATVELLNSVTIILGAVAILLGLAIADASRLRRYGLDLREWRPTTPTWLQTLIIGLVVGLVSFAMLAALVPESQSDAIRQHLPIAREIWQTGSAPAFEPMSASDSPIQAQLLFAVVYGFGGIPAAKLVQTMVGLATIVGVAGLGWLCAGRVAAFVAAVLFGTMPIVLWEIGHAYIDLFPVLYTVASAMCIILWQRRGLSPWLASAGALAAFGFATKLTMLWLLLALAGGIFLVGRLPWQWRNRVAALVVFGLGTVVIAPWLMRSYGITGTLPGLGFLTYKLRSVFPWLPLFGGGGAFPASDVAPPVNEMMTGVAATDVYASSAGISVFDLIRIPWQLTFAGERYHSQGAGDIGIAILMLLPLALFAPRTRSTALLAIAATISYVAWWLTLLITRHLLPTLAIVAALIGMGVACLASAPQRTKRLLAQVAFVGLAIGCVAAPFLYLPNWKAKLPVDLLIGRETAAEYLSREVPSAAALQQAGDALPADAPVGYIGIWEGPQIYTEARLFYFAGTALGWNPQLVESNLDANDIHYLVWNRPESSPEDWQSVVVSTPFLRQHTRILAGDRDSYVFAILPDEGLTWGEKDPPQLLQDPELQKVGRKGDVWTAEGKVKPEGGTVPLRPRSSLAQQVPVTRGRAYVLTATSACTDPDDSSQLTLRWLDDKGAELDEASETVIPGTEPSEQFIWRRAPQGAAKVSAEVTTARGGEGATCTFDAVSLLELS